MKPLRAALNLGEKNENLSPSADVLHNTSNLVISRCCFADDGKEMDRNEKMHVQSVQSYCFCSLNMQICNVLVAVAVVVAKAPYSRCRQNFKFGDFMSSLCRGPLRYLLKSVLHVQHDYLRSFNQ